jgi:surface protein
MLIKYQGQFVGKNGMSANYKDSPAPSLPPYTIRLKYKQGTTPTFSKGTGVLVDEINNIWDLTYENTNWLVLLQDQSNLLEVIEANTTGVTNMQALFARCRSLTNVPWFNTSSVTTMKYMFYECNILTNVPLYDTSNVLSMQEMFDNCRELTSIPLFDTSKVTNMNYMFYNCINVQSGALALYLQASTQTTPPTNHTRTFNNCGSNTTEGAAELAQIPSSWGGTGA